MVKGQVGLVEQEKKRDRNDFTLTLILSIIVGITLIFFIVFQYFVFLVTIDGSSMENTLQNGETLIASKYADIDRGDIVVIEKQKVENEQTINYLVIKRVIGIAGDVVRINSDEGCVYLKKAGESTFVKLDEPYIKQPNSTRIEGQSQVDFTVREGEIFYLGDNRRPSMDSRSDGCCSTEKVMGVVKNWAVSIKGFTTKVFSNVSQKTS